MNTVLRPALPGDAAAVADVLIESRRAFLPFAPSAHTPGKCTRGWRGTWCLRAGCAWRTSADRWSRCSPSRRGQARRGSTSSTCGPVSRARARHAPAATRARHAATADPAVRIPGERRGAALLRTPLPTDRVHRRRRERRRSAPASCTSGSGNRRGVSCAASPWRARPCVSDRGEPRAPAAPGCGIRPPRAMSWIASTIEWRLEAKAARVSLRSGRSNGRPSVRARRAEGQSARCRDGAVAVASPSRCVSG